MSTELKSELGTEMSIAELKAQAKEEKPLFTRLYTEWRRTQPKTTSKEEMSANYKAYKLSMGIILLIRNLLKVLVVLRKLKMLWKMYPK